MAFVFAVSTSMYNILSGVLMPSLTLALSDMARMFRLFQVKSLKNGLQPIGDITRKYINEQGDKVCSASLHLCYIDKLGTGGGHIKR